MPSILKVKTVAPKILRIGAKRMAGKSDTAPAVIDTSKTLGGLVGKAVFFALDGQRVAGKALRVDGDSLVVGLAVPSRDGLLVVTENEVRVKHSDLQPTAALISQRTAKRFEVGAAVELPTDRKAVPVYAGGAKEGVVVDYRDVVIEGYASTFVGTTARDRGGDYIQPGAFDGTIAEFMKNPVILTNHYNEVHHLAGSWTKVGVNQRGLAVQGAISNAPDVIGTRFKLVEGHLKGLSIGGIWYYNNDDHRGIEEADLFEISLVAVPMNPDALAFTRSLKLEDCKAAFTRFWKSNTALRET